MAALRSILALIVLLAVGGAAQAQVVHRTDVPAGEATPTGGSFSIRFPVPFNDIEARAEEPGAPTAIVMMLTGLDGDIRFSATETPYEGMTPRPMEEFMDSVKRRPGAAVADVHRETSGNMEILSFALTAPESDYYFRMVRANKVQYMQVVQFPEAQRAEATAMKDEFFNSFKLSGS